MSNEGLTVKEKIIIFFPIVFVIIFVLLFFKFKQNSKDIFYNEVVPSEYHGVITEKYRIFSHNEPFVRFRDEKILQEISTFNWIDLFEKASIGDSIYKIKGDTMLNIKKKGVDSVYRFQYFYDKGWGIVKRKW